ncbi:hypothetical protein NOR53_2585 [gamma proteobacterium NOR5-3]|nr:hypothetical protein NOR53_2585 [gamma proteobacterium NOR5-3]
MAKTRDVQQANSLSEQSTHRLSALRRLPLAIARAVALAALSSSALSAPILTEIHYNGIASGADPDEFIELSNADSRALDLAGWRFTRGISYFFETGVTLAPATSLVLARDPGAFLGVFSDFAGEIYDFSGALSNSGETLTLTNSNGIEAWSVTYDDRGAWPQQADGLGSSLQLILGSQDASQAGNWTAGPPTPGRWGPLVVTPTRVSVPASIALVAVGLLALGRHQQNTTTA